MDLSLENNGNYCRDETSPQQAMNQDMAVMTWGHQTGHTISSGSFSSQESLDGVVKIVPSDVDVSIIESNVHVRSQQQKLVHD